MLCREHGRQLTELAAEKSLEDSLQGFGLFGVVRETGVDDEGLAEFHDEYYNFPLYRDETFGFYQALGNKSVMSNVSWKPWRWYKDIKKMNKRVAAKNIQGNLVGDGATKGGVIIFGSDGKPKYAYPEQTGSEMVIADLLAAVQDVRNGGDSSKSDL